MTKKPWSAWRKFLLGWTLFLLGASAGFCFYFYRYASVYERTQPSLVMDELMEMSRDEWKAALTSSVPVDERGFEDLGALFDDYFESYARSGALQYRSDLAASGPEQSVFVVYAGRMPLARVYLRPADGTKTLGRSEWELDRMDAGEFLRGLHPVSLEIDAPADAQLFLNGKMLGAEDLRPERVQPPYLSALEQRFDAPGAFVRYRIDALYGELSVVDGEGRGFLSEETGDAQLVRFVLDQRGTQGFCVEAPDAAVVTVNGAALAPSEAETSYSLFHGLDDYAGDGAWQMLRYRAEGLYAQPELSAVMPDGTALVPVAGSDGTLYFLFDEDDALPDGVREAAEDYFAAYMAYSASGHYREQHELLVRILPGSELRRYVEQSTEAMHFASATDVDYQALQFEHFHALGERCVFCTVSFRADLTANTWYDTLNYDVQSGYQLVFVRKDGQWLCAAQFGLGA